MSASRFRKRFVQDEDIRLAIVNVFTSVPRSNVGELARVSRTSVSSIVSISLWDIVAPI